MPNESMFFISQLEVGRHANLGSGLFMVQVQAVNTLAGQLSGSIMEDHRSLDTRGFHGLVNPLSPYMPYVRRLPGLRPLSQNEYNPL